MCAVAARLQGVISNKEMYNAVQPRGIDCLKLYRAVCKSNYRHTLISIGMYTVLYMPRIYEVAISCDPIAIILLIYKSVNKGSCGPWLYV